MNIKCIKRIVSLWAMLLIGQCLITQAAPPILRQPLTTNEHFGPLPSDGHVPIWNGAVGKWSNNVPPQAWTNEAGFIHPSDHVPGGTSTNSVLIRSAATNDGTSGLIFNNGGRSAIYANGRPARSNDLAAGESAGVYGIGGSGLYKNFGVVGWATPKFFAGGTNIAVAGIATPLGSDGVYVGGFFGISVDDTLNVVYESSALIADTLDMGGAAFIARTNNGGFKLFEVDGIKTTNATPMDVAGLTTLYAGLASRSTLATNAVGGTGYTNNQTINQTVYLSATAAAFTVKDRSGATLYVSPTLTTTLPVTLQPGWSITAASGLTGTALPW